MGEAVTYGQVGQYQGIAIRMPEGTGVGCRFAQLYTLSDWGTHQQVDGWDYKRHP